MYSFMVNFDFFKLGYEWAPVITLKLPTSILSEEGIHGFKVQTLRVEKGEAFHATVSP